MGGAVMTIERCSQHARYATMHIAPWRDSTRKLPRFPIFFLSFCLLAEYSSGSPVSCAFLSELFATTVASTQYTAIGPPIRMGGFFLGGAKGVLLFLWNKVADRGGQPVMWDLRSTNRCVVSPPRKTLVAQRLALASGHPHGAKSKPQRSNNKRIDYANTNR